MRPPPPTVTLAIATRHPRAVSLSGYLNSLGAYFRMGAYTREGVPRNGYGCLYSWVPILYGTCMCIVKSMDDNCGEWVEYMGVASWCG